MTTQVPSSLVMTGLPKLRPRLQSEVLPTAAAGEPGQTTGFCLNSHIGTGGAPGTVTSSA